MGVSEKLAAHIPPGKLHRAVSIYVFDSKRRLLLQKRAITKYHSPGLWSNTCCGHPRPKESSIEAATRRLKEEMGVECPLRDEFGYLHRRGVGSELTEWEYGHVFIGKCDCQPIPNPREVESWKWAYVDWLREDMAMHESQYTVWFQPALGAVMAHISQRQKDLNALSYPVIKSY